MIVGVPREIMSWERRVSITPSGTAALVARGHTVLVQEGAGEGAGFTDSLYAAAGAAMHDTAAEVWGKAELITKVKEPLPEEYPYFRPGLAIFTFLHLAAHPGLVDELKRHGTVAIAYDTIELPDGTLPCLAPMSEIAGRLAVQEGAICLETRSGGRGVLLAGVSGTPPARVLILGGGIAGMSACNLAVGMRAAVTIMDISRERLAYLHDLFQGRAATLISSEANIRERLPETDLVVGTAHVTGAKAPVLLDLAAIDSMPRGSALVDVSIDQGGSAVTSRPTTHDQPTYLERGVVHYCVANMPAAVPVTATRVLTDNTLRYILELADLGFEGAMKSDSAVAKGINVMEGEVVHPAVAEALSRR